MPEVTVMDASQHEGHGPGEYRAGCRACRMEGIFRRLAEEVQPIPRDAGFVAHCRAKFKSFLWSDGMARALEQAADAGLTLREVVSAVHEARAEVGGRK